LCGSHKTVFSLQTGIDHSQTTGGRHLKFGMEIDHKHFQQIIFETLPGS